MESEWVRVYCRNADCRHEGAIQTAELARIWPGRDEMALFARLRRRARCTACGHIGALTYTPSWGGIQVGMKPFPGPNLVHPPAPPA